MSALGKVFRARVGQRGRPLRIRLYETLEDGTRQKPNLATVTAVHVSLRRTPGNVLTLDWTAGSVEDADEALIRYPWGLSDLVASWVGEHLGQVRLTYVDGTTEIFPDDINSRFRLIVQPEG